MPAAVVGFLRAVVDDDPCVEERPKHGSASAARHLGVAASGCEKVEFCDELPFWHVADRIAVPCVLATCLLHGEVCVCQNPMRSDPGQLLGTFIARDPGRCDRTAIPRRLLK
jgi:hypothetical protein